MCKNSVLVRTLLKPRNVLKLHIVVAARLIVQCSGLRMLLRYVALVHQDRHVAWF